MDKYKLYNSALRGLPAIVAVVLWAVSINFSIDGFRFQLPGYDGVALALGLSVTVLELIGNHGSGKKNLTIGLLVLLAYAYGLWTNLSGLTIAMGLTLQSSVQELVLPTILAIIFEVAPEPLLVLALFGDARGKSDPIAGFLGMLGGAMDWTFGSGGSKGQRQQQNAQRQQYPNQSRQQPGQRVSGYRPGVQQTQTYNNLDE